MIKYTEPKIPRPPDIASKSSEKTQAPGNYSTGDLLFRRSIAFEHSSLALQVRRSCEFRFFWLSLRSSFAPRNTFAECASFSHYVDKLDTCNFCHSFLLLQTCRASTPSCRILDKLLPFQGKKIVERSRNIWFIPDFENNPFLLPNLSLLTASLQKI